MSTNSIDPRRKQELLDSHIIGSGRSDMANMPRQAIHHEWPKLYYDPHIIDPGIPENYAQSYANGKSKS